VIWSFADGSIDGLRSATARHAHVHRNLGDLGTSLTIFSDELV